VEKTSSSCVRSAMLVPEQRIPQDHPLRSLRTMSDEALRQLMPRFNKLYAKTGRPSIAPEKLLRALLIQVLYSVRSERMLMEQLDYNLLFRWFVGLNMDDVIWDATVFTKNRQRLLEGDIADAFFAAVLKQARQRCLPEITPNSRHMRHHQGTRAMWQTPWCVFPEPRNR
jgi:transposase